MVTGLAGLGGTLFKSEEHKLDKYDTKALGSNITAGNNIIAKTGSTKIVGSNLIAENSIGIKSDIGKIEILSAQEKTDVVRLDKTIKVSAKNLFEVVSDTLKKTQDTKETKLKFTVATAQYDKEAEQTNSINHVSSNLIAKNGDIILDASDDINIEGSNLKALNTIALASEVGNITIKEVQNTKKSKKQETHAKADLSITVQNEYVEIGTAVKAAAESAKQLKKTKDDYQAYKKGIKTLENTLALVKKDYKNKVAGIDYEDIEDLSDIIDDVNDDKKYYVAAIAAAAADLVTKTLAIAQQAAAAGASSGTWGFSVGISLDLVGSKTKSENEIISSLASSIEGKNISLNTNKDLDTNINISGSNLEAQESLNISTGELNVKASQDSSTSKSDSKDISGSVSMTMYGSAGGPTVSLGYGEQHNTSETLNNNNSNLLANNINITTKNDANFEGATVRADDTLNMDIGKDLNVISQRDVSSSNSKGFNLSAGFSIGASDSDAGRDSNGDSTFDTRTTANQKRGARAGNGKIAGANASIGSNTGRTKVKQTVLSSLTGDKVNIKVEIIPI